MMNLALALLSMKSALLLVVLSMLGLGLTAQGQTEQQKATIKVLNKTSERLMGGDVSALDDVKALPGDDAVAGLLMFVGQYHYLYKATPTQKEIAAKASQYVTECPTAEDYITRLFKKEEGRGKSGMLMKYREAALNALCASKNQVGIGLVFKLIDEDNLDVPVSDFGIALARAEFPGAPFNRKSAKGTGTPEGIEKWKDWWKQNRTEFPEK